jgi:hypothetical protein
MLGLLFDVIILLAVLHILGRSHAYDFQTIALMGIGISVANLVVVLLLAGVMGLWVVIPVIAVDMLALMFLCCLAWERALAGAAMILAAKVAIALMLG